MSFTPLSRSRGLFAALAFACALLCGTTAPAHASSALRRLGLASYYGPGFHGRATASGERFDAGAMTAAHRWLPFGTRLLVTNLLNGRAVIVRVNDRGPHVKGRILDLSTEAASRLGFVTRGVTRIRIEVLDA